MKLLYTLVCFCFLSTITGQNTFSLLLSSSSSTLSTGAAQNDSGEINVIISEFDGLEYGPKEIKRGYILSFDNLGDTTIHNFSFGDTLFSFGSINSLQDGFLLTGLSMFPNEDYHNLFVCKLDDNKQVVWKKNFINSTFDNPLIYNVFTVSNNFYLCGSVELYDGQYTVNHPYLLKLSNSGNIISETIYPSSLLAGEYSFMISPDSLDIWMFVHCCLDPLNGPSVTKFDLNLNYLASELFFTQGAIYRIGLKGYVNSTFLISSIQNRPGATYQDDDFYINRMDTSFNILSTNNFGSQDTSEVPSRFIPAIDFNNPDSIFLAGYKNKLWGIPNQNTIDWIIAGQVDSLLQPRYLNFIGGDGYYETNYGIATNDGGHFICAGKYNSTTLFYDLLFLKLNNQGILVNSKSPTLQIMKSNISPNPASDFINIECYVPNAIVEVYNASGILVMNKELNIGITPVDISNLKKSCYYFRILYSGRPPEIHKVIKI